MNDKKSQPRRRSTSSRRKRSGSGQKPPKRTRLSEEETQNLARKAKARSELYEIFSLTFQESPTPEMLAIYRHSAFLSIVEMLLPEDTLAVWKKFAESKTPLEHLQARLRMEHDNLFLVPTSQHVASRESDFYFKPGDPQAGKRRLDDLQKFFRRIGMTPMAKFKDEPDHISQIMHFMSVVCDRERDHLEKKNAGQLSSVCRIEADFTQRHLAEWIPQFRERIHQATRYTFFRNVADLMLEFITLEKEWVPSLAKTYNLPKQGSVKEEGGGKSEGGKKQPRKKKTRASGGDSSPGQKKQSGEGGRKSSRRRRGGRRRRPRKRSGSGDSAST